MRGHWQTFEKKIGLTTCKFWYKYKYWEGELHNSVHVPVGTKLNGWYDYAVTFMSVRDGPQPHSEFTALNILEYNDRLTKLRKDHDTKIIRTTSLSV